MEAISASCIHTNEMTYLLLKQQFHFYCSGIARYMTLLHVEPIKQAFHREIGTGPQAKYAEGFWHPAVHPLENLASCYGTA